MPIARGKVKSCRKNRKGFQLDDGNWYSRMDGEPMPVEDWRENGVTVEVEWFAKDGWNNFTKNPVVIHDEEPAEQKPSGGSKGFKKVSGGGFKKGDYNSKWHAYQDKEWQGAINDRITRQNALNNAVTLVSAVNKDEVGPDTVELVTTVANLFVEWVEGGTE